MYICRYTCDKAQIQPYTVVKCDFALVHRRSVWESVPDWGYMHTYTHTCTYIYTCVCRYFSNHKSSAHLCQTTILHTQTVCCVRIHKQFVWQSQKSALHSTGAQANHISPNSHSAGTYSGHSSCFCTVSFTFSKCLFSCLSLSRLLLYLLLLLFSVGFVCRFIVFCAFVYIGDGVKCFLRFIQVYRHTCGRSLIPTPKRKRSLNLWAALCTQLCTFVYVYVLLSICIALIFCMCIMERLLFLLYVSESNRLPGWRLLCIRQAKFCSSAQSNSQLFGSQSKWEVKKKFLVYCLVHFQLYCFGSCSTWFAIKVSWYALKRTSQVLSEISFKSGKTCRFNLATFLSIFRV